MNPCPTPWSDRPRRPLSTPCRRAIRTLRGRRRPCPAKRRRKAASRRDLPVTTAIATASSDRKSVVSGKSVSARVDLGGRRTINTKYLTTHPNQLYLNKHITSL